MKTVGIIAEYDPFHNGHAYHLKKAKEITGADAVVAVISGSFTQRGDAAFYSKKTRARAALWCWNCPIYMPAMRERNSPAAEQPF